MLRYYLVEQVPAGSFSDYRIYAEGVLFGSGLAATCFLDKETSGMMTWPDMGRARAVHVGLGGRLIAWHAKEVPMDLDIRACKPGIARYPDGPLVGVYVEPPDAKPATNTVDSGPPATACTA